MTRGRANPPLTSERVAMLSDPQENGCLLWLDQVSMYGYPLYSFGGSGKKIRVHVWVWEDANGPVPEGWTVDHQCHDPELCKLNRECPHRRCVELTHLKAMTNAENAMRGGGWAAVKARQTECVHGHSLAEGDPNLYVTPKGRRQCRTCRAEALRRWALNQPSPEE